MTISGKRPLTVTTHTTLVWCLPFYGSTFNCFYGRFVWTLAVSKGGERYGQSSDCSATSTDEVKIKSSDNQQDEQDSDDDDVRIEEEPETDYEQTSDRETESDEEEEEEESGGSHKKRKNNADLAVFPSQ